MVYENNPFNSTKGQEIMKNLFDNIFLHDDKKMEVESKDDIVAHFRGTNSQTLINTINLLKRFLKGFIHIGFSQSFDAGIYICPYCRRRDFMWFWQFEDFGIYDEDDWLSSVQPKKSGFRVGEKAVWGWMLFCRVICNSVTTCNECHQTTTGTYGTCQNCSSGDVAHAGCGRESYSIQMVKEEQAVNMLPTLEKDITPQLAVGVPSSSTGGAPRYQVHGTIPFFFRITYGGLPIEGIVIKGETQEQRIEALSYIPHMEVGYQYQSFGKMCRRPYGYHCPNEACQFERFAPLFGEDYSITTTLSWKRGVEQTGGTVNNMGVCPKCNATLIPNVSAGDMSQITEDYIDPSTGEPWFPDPYGGHWRKKTSPMRDAISDYTVNQLLLVTAIQTMRIQNVAPVRFPISKMNFAFVKEPQKICIECEKGAGSFDEMYFWTTQEVSVCPDCGHMDHHIRVEKCSRCSSRMIYHPRNTVMDICQVGHRGHTEHRTSRRVFYPPKMLTIINPQPLEDADASGFYCNQPIWAIRLQTENDYHDEYNIRVDIPQTFSLNALPVSPTTGPDTGAGITLCPNDKAAPVYEEEMERRLRDRSSKILPAGPAEEHIYYRIKNLDGNFPRDWTSRGKGGYNVEEYIRDLKAARSIPPDVSEYYGVRIKEEDGDIMVLVTSSQLMPHPPGYIPALGDLAGVPWECWLMKENLWMPPEGVSPLGQTSPGYTYAITEGRSREAFQSLIHRQWVDASPQCSSYHDRLNPESPLPYPFHYPRWIQTPSWDVRPPENPGECGGEIVPNGEYSWDDSSHFVQDYYRVNDYLSNFMEPSPTGPVMIKQFHFIKLATDPILNEAQNQLTIVWMCEACSMMYKRGKEAIDRGIYPDESAPAVVAERGAVQYYRSRGFCDANGITTDEEMTPQKCLDAECEHEATPVEYTDEHGIEHIIPGGPWMWGIDLGQIGDKPHNGQEMLFRPMVEL